MSSRIKDAIFKFEKLKQEGSPKADENSTPRKIHRDLNGNLKSPIKHVRAANDKLGADSNEKLKNEEDEKTRLEANEKVESPQVQKTSVYRQKNKSLKGFLSFSTKRSSEIENNLKAYKEQGETDGMIQKLKEENKKVEEQLNLNNEQFKHLEEAHEKLKDQFKSSMKEWELEKSTFLDEISSLQSKLDSHVRTSQDPQHELQKCQQALAHEESQRKHLEVELSKLKQENHMMKQLEMKDAALITAQKDINDKELQHSQQKEVYDERENFELDERLCESEMEYELQTWKEFVDRLKNDLKENNVMRKALENSLLEQVEYCESLKQENDNLVYKLEEEEKRTDYLQLHVFILEQELKLREIDASVPARGETIVSSEDVEGRYLQIIEEKDKILEEFQKEVLLLEQKLFRREFENALIAKGNMERTNEHEGKFMRKDELMQQVASLEQEFMSSLTSFSLQLADKQAEINQVQEACDKITTAETLAALEIEEKKLMIVELEDNIHDIEEKLKLQEENCSQLKHVALDAEAEMDVKQLKLKELTNQTENKLRGSDVLHQNLKMENRSLLQKNIGLSPQRINLLGCIMGLGDNMCDSTTEDSQLVDILRSLVQTFENDCVAMNL